MDRKELAELVVCVGFCALFGWAVVSELEEVPERLHEGLVPTQYAIRFEPWSPAPLPRVLEIPDAD